MNTILSPLVTMTTDEPLAWEPGDGMLWQLENGRPVQMAPTAETHGAIRAWLVFLLTQHLLSIGHAGNVVVTPGIVPRVLARRNICIPDVAVAARRSTQAEPVVQQPILAVEILSPSNERETWSNFTSFCQHSRHAGHSGASQRGAPGRDTVSAAERKLAH